MEFPSKIKIRAAKTKWPEFNPQNMHDQRKDLQVIL